MRLIKWLQKVKRLDDNQGLSLSELLVSIFIFSILSASLLAVVVVGQRSWSTNSVKIGMRQELRKSMETMINDLRQAGDDSIADVPADDTWYTSITFQVPQTVTGGIITWDSNAIQYTLGGTNGDQLQKITGGSTQIVSQDIQSLQFRRLSTAPNILEVALAAQDTVDLTQEVLTMDLDFEIELRN
jgi:Tfp pilus assembly protein PilV